MVGSIARDAWGEPRLTHDINIVVRLDDFDAERVCQAFAGEDFYVSRTAAHEAVMSRGQSNLLHPSSGNKIGFMVVGSAPWDDSQLRRRRLAPLFPNRDVYIAAPEELILGKLLYYQDDGSEKHVRDIPACCGAAS